MDVYEAVTSRRAVRGFTDRPVPREVLGRVLSAAAWAPSGSNIQPWHIYVLTGAPLAELKKLAGERAGRGRPLGRAGVRDVPARAEVPLPRAQSPPSASSATARWASRARTWRRASGRRPRTGTFSARPPPCSATSTATWACRSGPTSACICRPSCCCSAPKGCTAARRWRGRVYRKTVAEVLSPPDGLILFCGMSIGYEDATVAHPRTGRAPLDETVTFVDG